MIYFTSDTHFNHKNILTYEPITRPFDTVEEMNETIIKNWNDTVSPEDTIYVLGDFFLGPDLESVKEIISRLNGTIHLIRGNHDSDAKLKIYEELGIDVRDIGYLRYKDSFFVMCHFPIISPDFMEMIHANNATNFALYGHVHSKAPKGFVNGAYHVGVDTNNLTPVSIEQIWQESRTEI